MSTAVAEAKKTYVIRPREKWILIEKIVRGEELVDGVIRPAEKDERSQKGIVVALSGCAGRDSNGNAIPWDLKVGDMVLFSNYAMEIPDVGELTGNPNLVLLQSDEVFAGADEV